MALEFILENILDILGHETGGLSFDELISSLITKQFAFGLKNLLGSNSDSPHKLMQSIGVRRLPDEKQCLTLAKTIDYRHPLAEISIMNSLFKRSANPLALSLILLAVAYAKWRGISNDIGFKYVASNAGPNIWAGNLLAFLDNWFKPDATWEVSLSPLITFILDWHDRIMFEKWRLDSCWLHRSDGKIHRDQDYQPVLRSSRHWNCVNILSDIGYLETNSKGDISLTRDGRKLLSTWTHPK